MQVIKNDNVYQITFLPNLFPVNCFVVELEDELIVVDMGMKGFIKKVQEIHNHTRKPVTKLLLTHAHSDHVQAVNDFKKVFHGTSVGISKRDERLLSKDLTTDTDEAGNKIRGSFARTAPETDFTFTEGDNLSDITVISTPGHTPGSVSFHLPASGIVIAGDAFQTKGGIAVSGDTRPAFPFPAMATWDQGTALISAKKVQSLTPDIVYVGHGKPMTHPNLELEKAIRRFEKKPLRQNKAIEEVSHEEHERDRDENNPS